MTIFALDIATNTGWARGAPGDAVQSGSIRFASAGASREAIFAAALTWATMQFKTHRPSTVIWEAPMPTSQMKGKTSVDTTAILFGLPAVIGAVAYVLGIYDLRVVAPRDVRLHFLGENPKRSEGKRLTIRQCRAIGWAPQDDNEADALAIWHYMASLLEPKLALRPTPLFGRARA